MNLSNLGRILAYETLKYCKANGPSVPSSEVHKYLDAKIVPGLNLENRYLDSYDGTTLPKWASQLRFTLVDFDKAGWFKKSFPKRGYWTITEDGVKALNKHKDAEKLGLEANKRYRQWLEQSKRQNNIESVQITFNDGLDKDKAMPGLDEILDSADLRIKDHLKTIDPYVFQDVVGALLTAMGYFVDFIAPKGRDGGIDLVCYQDPLGIKAPRMKVQVKHRPDDSVGRPTLSEFADQIKQNEVGIFVTSGTFSSEARRHAIAHDKHIRLIDGTEFIELIEEHYERLDKRTKDLIPLEKVYHLKR